MEFIFWLAMSITGAFGLVVFLIWLFLKNSPACPEYSDDCTTAMPLYHQNNQTPLLWSPQIQQEEIRADLERVFRIKTAEQKKKARYEQTFEDQWAFLDGNRSRYWNDPNPN